MKKSLITIISIMALAWLLGWLWSITDHYNRIVLDAPKKVRINWPDGSRWVLSDDSRNASVEIYYVNSVDTKKNL